jgi:hypothetical protein
VIGKLSDSANEPEDARSNCARYDPRAIISRMWYGFFKRALDQVVLIA